MNDTATLLAHGAAGTIGEALDRAAAARPDALAVSHDGQRLTFAELIDRISAVAATLGTGDAPVALALQPGVDQVVTALGIIAAGRGYVALDVEAPASRVAMIFDLVEPELVITTAQGEDRLPPETARVMVERLTGPGVTGRSDRARSRSGHPDAVAYVAFTSGTTGEPKGVAVTHRGVVGLVEALRSELGLAPEDRVLSFAPLAFDASTFEFFGSLLVGASIHVPPPSTFQNPGELGKFIGREGVTVAWLTAGLFHQIVAQDARALAGLRVLVVGGDVVNPAAIHEIMTHRPDGLTVVNGYGPTENTTFSTIFRASAPDEVGGFPIGSALPGRSAFVLDDWLREVGTGEEGELYVGGNGLARGYVGRPGSTAARFIAHPTEPGHRLYRTGDRAIRSATGLLEFRGRRDRQVKIRGYRIELAEVEAVLAAFEGVRDVAVIKDRGEDGLERLVAHVAVGDVEVGRLELRRCAQQALPGYAVPSVIAVHAELPLTSQGKVDFHALGKISVLPRPRLSVEYEPPHTGTETEIAALWEDHLRIHPIGRNDDFFELGGYSLAGMRISGELQRGTQIRITPYEFYSSPTVASLARLLKDKVDRDASNR